VSAQANYCTIPDITELLGATAATWMAWVRKDAYVLNQGVFSDFDAAGKRRWTFGAEAAENTWKCFVGDNTNIASSSIANLFTVGWHFAWCRFTGGSATGLEIGIDSSVAAPSSTSAIAALGVGVLNQTLIGKQWVNAGTYVYSSITLAALGIAARALTDEQIAIWREKYRPLIGV